MAQPALQVFGGWFEGIQKAFWFWQVLGVAQSDEKTWSDNNDNDSDI